MRAAQTDEDWVVASHDRSLAVRMLDRLPEHVLARVVGYAVPPVSPAGVSHRFARALLSRRWRAPPGVCSTAIESDGKAGLPLELSTRAIAVNHILDPRRLLPWEQGREKEVD